MVQRSPPPAFGGFRVTLPPVWVALIPTWASAVPRWWCPLLTSLRVHEHVPFGISKGGVSSGRPLKEFPCTVTQRLRDSSSAGKQKGPPVGFGSGATSLTISLKHETLWHTSRSAGVSGEAARAIKSVGGRCILKLMPVSLKDLC